MGRRDTKMDYLKGLLVAGMILCHVFQFFVPLNQHPLSVYMTWYVNAVTFSGFVFAFGYTNALAYYSKEFGVSYKRMLMNAIRLLIAFYLSGIAFNTFVRGMVLSSDTVIPILLLKDIPGWSEFILSFAGYMLIGCIGFPLFKWLMEKDHALLTIALMLLTTTWFPYDLVTNKVIGVLVGTRTFASFPVIQYMPYYLIGIYFYKHQNTEGIKPWFVALVSTFIGVGYIILNDGVLPERFPPSIFWLLLPAVPVYAYYRLARVICRSSMPQKYITDLGRGSMFYLLLSNFMIFSLSGTRALIGVTPIQGIGITVLILWTIAFLGRFISAGGDKVNRTLPIEMTTMYSPEGKWESDSYSTVKDMI